MAKIKIIFIILLLLPNQLSAKSLGKHMGEFWDSLNGTSNITNPQFIKSQKAGHLSLGGMQFRSGVENVQLASMQLPSISAGCGGIDFFGGGFSFVDSDQLVNLIHKIGANATGLLMQMAIEQLTPMFSSQIKYFQNLARSVNDLNINSCNTAKNLISGAGSMIQSTKTYACRTYGMRTGRYSDASEANEKCTSGGQATSTANSASEAMKSEFPLGSINIAWKSLKDSGYINVANSNDLEFAQLLMTLSGTVLVLDATNDSSNPLIVDYYPALKKDNVIKILIEGGEFIGLGCSDASGDCLDLSEDKKYQINAQDSYLGKVNAAIDEITSAIKNNSDEDFSDGTYKLLSFSSIPIYKILNVYSSYYADNMGIGHIAEYLAYDILYGYMNHVNQLVNKASARYRNKKSYQEVFQGFFEHQKEIKSQLEHKRSNLHSRFKSYYDLMARTEMIEKMLAKDLAFKFNSTKR